MSINLTTIDEFLPKEEFNKISEKLGKLSTEFSNNVLDATNEWFLILNKKSLINFSLFTLETILIFCTNIYAY